jgi:hypothetical protein
LLTTHPVATLVDAKQITHFYRQRWTIEQLFRVMKSKGFDIEAVRVADNGLPPSRCCKWSVSVMAPKAGHWRMSSMRPANRPSSRVCDPRMQDRTAEQSHPKGSLAYASWVCARLGGWTGYYGKPGRSLQSHASWREARETCVNLVAQGAGMTCATGVAVDCRIKAGHDGGSRWVTLFAIWC